MLTHEVTHVQTPPTDFNDIKSLHNKITHESIHEAVQKANGLDIKKLQHALTNFLHTNLHMIYGHKNISQQHHTDTLLLMFNMSGGESNYSEDKSKQLDVDNLSIGGYESVVEFV